MLSDGWSGSLFVNRGVCRERPGHEPGTDALSPGPRRTGRTGARPGAHLTPRNAPLPHTGEARVRAVSAQRVDWGRPESLRADSGRTRFRKDASRRTGESGLLLLSVSEPDTGPAGGRGTKSARSSGASSEAAGA